MDWFSWLSKSGLDPCLVYEYGLVFSHNELEEDDIPYFNHEFLQSMGISIAKHRLEILKLARKGKLGGGHGHGQYPRPAAAMSRLLGSVKKSKRCLVKLLRNWILPQTSSCSSSSALVVVQRPRGGSAAGSRWRAAMLKRNSKLKQPPTRLLLTNSSSGTIPGPLRIDSFSSPVVVCEEKMDGGDGDDATADDDGYWSTGVEEIRWDTMFQDLKPT